MSEENKALVLQFEGSWAKQDLEAVQECIHPAFEFDWSNSIGPFVGVYKGRDGLTRFWKDLHDTWDDFAPEAEEVIDCGADQVITVDVVRGRGKGSGIPMHARGVMLWTLRDGKIARVKMFQTKDEALEAVGLSQRDTNASS
jgi:ketosteroid isomerase-like protein